MHETTDMIQRHARGRRGRREPTRVETWARSPVFIIRVGLVAIYAINAYVATMALIAGVPVFSMTTPAGWSVIWASALLVAAAAAAFCASIDEPYAQRKGWRAAELISAGGVIIFAATYSIALHIVGFASGDETRQVAAASSLGLFVLPLARFLWLALQLGRKPCSSENA